MNSDLDWHNVEQTEEKKREAEESDSDSDEETEEEKKRKESDSDSDKETEEEKLSPLKFEKQRYKGKEFTSVEIHVRWNRVHQERGWNAREGRFLQHESQSGEHLLVTKANFDSILDWRRWNIPMMF